MSGTASYPYVIQKYKYQGMPMNATVYPESITVEVDSDVQSIVPEFLENRKKDCRLIGSLLERDSFSEIRTIGHRMKGAGGSYGFDDISEIGEVIEEAALAADKETISRAVLQLSGYLQRVKVVYV
jgi:HPt (histidine-containing phosphotransfer) domain-containing protein